VEVEGEGATLGVEVEVEEALEEALEMAAVLERCSEKMFFR
jgi:hypothetical protein